MLTCLLVQLVERPSFSAVSLIVSAGSVITAISAVLQRRERPSSWTRPFGYFMRAACTAPMVRCSWSAACAHVRDGFSATASCSSVHRLPTPASLNPRYGC